MTASRHAVTSSGQAAVPGPDGSSASVRPILASALAAAIAVAVGVALLLRVHENVNAGLGLLTSLPLLYFVCLAVLIVSFVALLLPGGADLPVAHRRVRGLVLSVHVLGFVLLLHGAAALVEQTPRFSTAWLHAGFTNYIRDHHATLPRLDARFNWPGFFVGAASVEGATGMHSAVSFIRWAPLAAVVLYLLPVYEIARISTRSRRLSWLALILFVLIDWVAQDYFAPETLGFVLYLIVIAVVLRLFGGGRVLRFIRRPMDWLLFRRSVDPGEPRALGHAFAWAGVTVLALVIIAQAVSHQLSPIMTVVALAALAGLGYTRLRALPVFAALMVVTWISLAATPYWIGHLHQIVGSVGQLGSVVNANISNRVQGSSFDHTLVVRSRLLFAGGVWLLAAAATVYTWRKRRLLAPIALLAFAPFVILLGQSYGGEALLRVFFFSSPFCAVLLAAVAAPLLRTARRAVAVALVMILATPLFITAHYGNEQFESITPDEVEAVQQLWRIAPAGSLVVSVTANVPWRFENVNKYRFRSGVLPLFETTQLQPIQTAMSFDAPKGASYLIITRGALNYSESTYGLKNGWFNQVKPKLVPRNGFTVVYQNHDATIYRYTGGAPS